MTESAGVSHCRTVQVVPLVRVHSLGDRRFDYSVPVEFQQQIKIGSVVGVRFGNRRTRGVVLGVDEPETGARLQLKPIDTLEDRSVPDELLALAEKMAFRYIAPLETCLRLVVPPAAGPAGSRGRPGASEWVFKNSNPENVVEGESRSGRPTVKQQRLLDCIPEEGVARAGALESAGVSRSVLDALVEKDLVRFGAAPDSGDEGDGSRAEESVAPWPELSAGQKEAVAQLSGLLVSPEAVTRQLWGITGSGKTEVYLHLAREVLSEGGGVILLVPEIALTPLMISRVRARFGQMVGVLHSGLTPAQRRREYARIADGEARVVIGARSAVFAPVNNLRLVVIDESHDTSYKQEESPGYHAKTVAGFRLEAGGGLLLEGSASPAVDAMQDPGSCVRMTERATGALPQCETVDMRHRSGEGILAGVTREALAETMRRDEQAIVLLNRRGYSGHVHCDLCGHVAMCEECELSLTYHSQTNRLHCHHCGRSYFQPGVCPSCREAPMARGGPGTERLSDEIGRLVSKDRVYRLDSDALTSGSRVQAILEGFSASRPGVLVGTQMVAKGHDFPNVTLVVVADADMGLFVPDFRAAERTFQLITQVSGRAGRAELPGRVLVQTWNPDVPCIRMALDRDEEAFYRRETAVRERLGYPPFRDLVRVVIAGQKAPVVQKAAVYLAERLKRHFDDGEVRGPARLATLRGRSRWHIVVSAKDGDRARAIVAQAFTQLRGPYRGRGVGLAVDVDPYAFV